MRRGRGWPREEGNYFNVPRRLGGVLQIIAPGDVLILRNLVHVLNEG